MARPREELHALMSKAKGLAIDPILEDYAVYFQPPPGVQMVYPCIRYVRENYRHRRADNKAYNLFTRYTVTVIDRDPDSDIPRQLVESIQMCNFDRSYVADNLYHSVLTVYY